MLVGFQIYFNCKWLQLDSNPEPLRPVWPNCWVFVYELNGSGFESSCCHVNVRFCFKQGAPWHSIKCGFTLKHVCDMTRTYNQTLIVKCSNSKVNYWMFRKTHSHLSMPAFFFALLIFKVLNPDLVLILLCHYTCLNDEIIASPV